MGMPRVYHDPDTVSAEERDDSPSAASDPGIGMFGIDVLTVNLVGS